MNNDDIVDNVKKWYSEHWESNKGQDCADYILIDGGNLIKDKKVLNLGCFFPSDEINYGHKAKEWVSIDFVPNVISKCIHMNIPGVTFKLMDARKLDFEDNYFDVVLDFSSGDQMPESHYNEVIRQIHKVLIPSGIFIVTFANYDYFRVKEVHGDFGYSRCYSPDELKDKILPIGFSFIKDAKAGSDRVGLMFEKEHK